MVLHSSTIVIIYLVILRKLFSWDVLLRAVNLYFKADWTLNCVRNF